MSRSRYYVGLATTMHDSALAIVDPDGTPVFAEATERYLQCKRAYNCPPDDLIRIPRLIREHCGSDVELVVACSWSGPYLAQLDAFIQAAPATADERDLADDLIWPLPDARALATAHRNSINQASLNLRCSRQVPEVVAVRRYDHHLSHAANAAMTSPFEACAIAVVDGFGEGTATGFFQFDRRGIRPLARPGSQGLTAAAPASLGMFHSRLCALCGFDPLKGEEWKVMGLASYGSFDPDLYQLLRPMVQVKGLTLTSSYSDRDLARTMHGLRAGMRPPGSSPLLSADLAHTGQLVFEEAMAELLQGLREQCGSDDLALSGGCALNSTWNGKIVPLGLFRRLHVPPAPADDGNALGAAWLAWMEDGGDPARRSGTATPYLGSALSAETLGRIRTMAGIRLTDGSATGEDEVIDRTADLLAAGKIVGWAQGKAEYGPRALGNRSILADPRDPAMVARINAAVKFRESFRPFAPSILDEHGPEYFQQYQGSPYMERTLRFRPEMAGTVPAVVHVDGTGRLQSVGRDHNPRFRALIGAFYARTGVPLVLNTSFNVMDRPIIHSVEDAMGMFCTTGLDALVVENLLFEKEGGG